MQTKIQKWGNSQGVRIAKNVLKEVRLSVGEEVNVTVQEGRILVTPLRKIHGRYRLEDLVAKIPQGYHSDEVDWGTPAGKETW